MSRIPVRHRLGSEAARMGRNAPKETVMAKYLMLKHYRSSSIPTDRPFAPDGPVDAHGDRRPRAVHA